MRPVSGIAINAAHRRGTTALLKLLVKYTTADVHTKSIKPMNAVLV